MGVRHASRRLALQALYALEMAGETEPREAVEHARAEGDCSATPDSAYLDDLVHRAWDGRAELDATIDRCSHRWRIRRMDRVDKSILRLATCELLFLPETPTPVVIDEAVRLAKEFGTPESPAFINGLLDRIAQEIRRPGDAQRGG